VYDMHAERVGIDMNDLSKSFDGAAALVFVEDSDGTDDGVVRLFNSMRMRGVEFYQSASNRGGLVAPGDVVLLNINCQWNERGGTNTDLISAVIDAIYAHPDGFSGEVVVADNGHAQFGNAPESSPVGMGGGSLDWQRPNSKNRDQSTLAVVRAHQAQGRRVTGVLWDTFTTVRVDEYEDGDFTDGFVVEDGALPPSGLILSYPKFTTEYGTHVSFRNGIWSDAAGKYDSDALKVIGMPVLKTHAMYQVTGAVKGYMGTTSDKLTGGTGFGGAAHNSIGLGGMGTQMALTRMPVFNIIDMIWIGPDLGGMPGVSYAEAVEVNKIAASTDPVALDVWAARNVLMVQVASSGRDPSSLNPTGTDQGTFGFWLRLTVDELKRHGHSVTMDEGEIVAHISEG